MEDICSAASFSSRSTQYLSNTATKLSATRTTRIDTPCVSSSHTALRLIVLLSFISILIANRYSFDNSLFLLFFSPYISLNLVYEGKRPIAHRLEMTDTKNTPGDGGYDGASSAPARGTEFRTLPGRVSEECCICRMFRFQYVS